MKHGVPASQPPLLAASHGPGRAPALTVDAAPAGLLGTVTDPNRQPSGVQAGLVVDHVPVVHVAGVQL